MDIPDIEIKKILYATDLSQSALNAFAYAVSLANRYRASIVMLHVLPETPKLLDAHVVGYIGVDRWEEIKRHHADEARDALIGKRRDRHAVREILSQFYEDARATNGEALPEADEIVVETGDPDEKILEVLREKDCDLIVMGTHGKRTFTDVMLGSTARRVVRRSPKPVMVVRLPDDDD